jgi:hypothetical protein
MFLTSPFIDQAITLIEKYLLLPNLRPCLRAIPIT